MVFLDSSFLVLVCVGRFCWCFGYLSRSFSRISGFGEILCGWFSSFVSCGGFLVVVFCAVFVSWVWVGFDRVYFFLLFGFCLVFFRYVLLVVVFFCVFSGGS